MKLQSFRSSKVGQLAMRSSLALAGTIVSTTVSLLLSQPQTIAAEQVMLKYNILERSIAVDELSEFAETGEASPELETYLKDSGQDPERVRELLSDEVEVRQLFLDEVLNSAPGEVILDKMGDFVHTSSGEANRQALRSALVLSAADDDRISLIEVLQNYPTQEVHVNGNRIASAYRQIQNIQDSITTVLDAIELPL